MTTTAHSSSRPPAVLVLRILIVLLGVGIVLQHYAAGLGLIAGRSMRTHAMLGLLLLAFSLVTLVAATVPRITRCAGASLGGVFLLLLAQPILISGLRTAYPRVAAWHAATGVLVVLLLVRAWRRSP